MALSVISVDSNVLGLLTLSADVPRELVTSLTITFLQITVVLLFLLLLVFCSSNSFLHSRVVRKIVRPSKSAPKGAVESLWGCDLFPGRLRTRFGLRFNTLLDEGLLESALVETLNIFPCIAGRLDQASLSCGVPAIINFDAGVVFEVVEHREAAMQDLPLAAEAWVPIHRFQLKMPPGLPGADEPLFTARLARFHGSGQSALFVDFSHLVGDFSSYMQFLKVWSHFMSSPGAPVPASLLPQPVNTRLNRLATPSGAEAMDEAKAREAVRASHGMGALLFGFVRAKISQVCTNRSMRIRVSAAGAKQLKAKLSTLMVDGEWASTFEVIVASFLSAKALAYGPNKQASFASVRFPANMRRRQDEQIQLGKGDGHTDDAPAFPAHFFGNAVGHVDLDLRGIFEDVRAVGGGVVCGDGSCDDGAVEVQVRCDTKSDQTQALLSAVRRVHCGLRRGLRRPSVVLRRAVEWTAAQDLLRTDEFVKGVQRQNNDFFLAGLDGQHSVFNEWTSFDPLVIDMGAGKRATGFVCMPEVNLVPNLNTLMPFDETGDMMLPCCMSHAEAKRLECAIEDLGLPFEILR